MYHLPAAHQRYIQVDNAKEVDIVMPMQKLLEYRTKTIEKHRVV